MPSIERQLRHAAASGQIVDLRTGVPDEDDITSGEKWGQKRCIQARAIVASLLNIEKPPTGGRPVLHLAGAKVIGWCPFRGVCHLWVSCCKQVAGGERREPGFAG